MIKGIVSVCLGHKCISKYDTPLIQSIIERYEVVSKKKMTIWFIGDIPYEVDLPE